MSYTITYYDVALQQEIMSFDASMLASYLHYTDIMIEEGPNLGLPATRALGKGLFELRLHGKDGIARVFFCTLIGQEIKMISLFSKKTQKTPQKELNKARKRMKEVKNENQ